MHGLVQILGLRLVAIATVATLFLPAVSTADDPKSEAPPTPRYLSLSECIAIGHENQPTVKAARLSVASAEAGLQALNNLKPIYDRLSPDIPYRRMQSRHGITIAQADLDKEIQFNTYSITRLYYSHVYARQQEETAASVIVQLDIYYKVVEELVKSGVRDPKMKVDQFTLYALQNTIGEIRLLKAKAETGQKQALAALKEAMGVDPTSFEFLPKDTELPIMAGVVTQEQVVDLALQRRPEMAMAAAAGEAFRLEICAQAQLRSKQTSTLAAGGDLHAKQIPIAHANGEYRPGAIPPEMPASLAGSKEDRVSKAIILSSRQDAVAEKILGLVRLEAINAFLEWEASLYRMKEAKRKFESSQRQVEETKAAAVARQNPEMLVTTEALAGKAQSEYVEAVFEYIKALTKLERVTAGGVRPAFPGK